VKTFRILTEEDVKAAITFWLKSQGIVVVDANIEWQEDDGTIQVETEHGVGGKTE
jgi:hypothetical protein